MSYLTSWTYGPGYLEAFLDILSMILITDIIALLLLLWMCCKPPKRPNDASFTDTSVVEKSEIHTSESASGFVNNVVQPDEIVRIEREETSTQTNVKKTKDQKTGTDGLIKQSSASVQAAEEISPRRDIETQTSDHEEDISEPETESESKDGVPPEIEKTESATQTKEKEMNDQKTETDGLVRISSVFVQTITEEKVTHEMETQTSKAEDELIEKKHFENMGSNPPESNHPLDRRKSRETITFKSGWRREVKLMDLIRAKLIRETRVQELEREEITEAEVEKELQPYLTGQYPIAGVIVTESGRKMSLFNAFEEGIITRGTAVSLLEAQAAVGSIIDPRDGAKMSVGKAKEIGLIDKKMAGIINRAERAVTGFKARSTGEILSLFQAMKRNLVVESHGIRLLEAQIATGGIIDPNANVRLPVEVAFERGLFDEHLHRILEDPSDDTKGFLDPNTGDNLTYLELLQRCVEDEETGLLLLPLLPEQERKEYMEKFANTSYLSSPTHSTRTFSASSEAPSIEGT